MPPRVIDLPGHHEAGGRFPDKNPAPVALRPVRLFRVATPTLVPFDEGLLHRSLADVMTARPPGVDLLGEHLKGTFGTRLHRDALLNGGVESLIRHGRHFLVSSGGKLLHFVLECRQGMSPKLIEVLP